MKIAVCIKQVPATNEVRMDREKGILLREGIAVKINPGDLVALECALQLKERYQADITAFTMGPPSARAVIVLSYAMGIDQGVLLSDAAFAGADVFATAYTLARALTQTGHYDLIICGKQTTDGDTGQVGPALAEHLGLPHVYETAAIERFEEDKIRVWQIMGHKKYLVQVKVPCVLVMTKDAYLPRLPSLKLKLKARKKPIQVIRAADLKTADLKWLGLSGSPTQVEKIYLPPEEKKADILNGDAGCLADSIISVLKQQKIVHENEVNQ